MIYALYKSSVAGITLKKKWDSSTGTAVPSSQTDTLLLGGQRAKKNSGHVSETGDERALNNTGLTMQTLSRENLGFMLNLRV